MSVCLSAVAWPGVGNYISCAVDLRRCNWGCQHALAAQRDSLCCHTAVPLSPPPTRLLIEPTG